ncbi:putative Venom serine carboxypeptidase [Paratrimastix pyriformis]|uniref:Carboxypeptidase n=1 Tax=Paratrimastix pyriformis TaxID=342808 RepID=A0ABQ8UQ59_9EUKA|nr:putative Venom serine carboxypeptidase [Paratrimastix pyriformis]
MLFRLALLFSILHFANCQDDFRIAPSDGSVRADKSHVMHPPASFGPVTSLPLYGPIRGVQHSGYVQVNAQFNSNIFYWMVEASESAPANAPLLLWFQGGPGSSSIDVGFFFEHGPFLFDTKNGRPVDNPTSWHHLAHVLYIDQPAGTGFSYTDSNDGFAKTLDDVANDIHTFITLFLKRYPQYAKLDLYVCGESYGGKYVPAISARLGQDASLNLKGLCIADGWSHPPSQLPPYTTVALINGLIDENTKKSYDKVYDQCLTLVEQGKWHDAALLCDPTFWSLRNATGSVNPYDIRAYGNYDFDPIDRYLKRNDTMAAIHANHPFGSTAEQVGQAIHDDFCQSVRPLLASLVERYQVLVYQGQFDLIVTTAGVLDLYWNLPWSGQAAYQRAPRVVWQGTDRAMAGYVKQAANFTLVEVCGAGHMVPLDQPTHAFELIKRFLYNIPWPTH